MKKFLLTLAVILTLGLAACSNSNKSTEVVDEIDSTEVVVDTVNVDTPVVDSVPEVDSTEVE